MRIAEAELAGVEHFAIVPLATVFVVEGVADCFAPLFPMQDTVFELSRRLLVSVFGIPVAATSSAFAFAFVSIRALSRRGG